MVQTTDRSNRNGSSQSWRQSNSGCLDHIEINTQVSIRGDLGLFRTIRCFMSVPGSVRTAEHMVLQVIQVFT